MRPAFALQSVLMIPAVFSSSLLGCSAARPNTSSAVTEIGPVPGVRVSLKADGLPGEFFQPGADTKCSNQIIGYRFVVWLDSQDVAVGFNTNPCFRQSPDRKVDGVLRVLVFDLKGTLKASRDLPYLADGNGEVVADGEAMPGPENTLLVRIESVNLDPGGRQESKSGVRLLDVNLKDVAQRDLFLEQTTFVEHDVVTESGSSTLVLDPFHGDTSFAAIPEGKLTTRWAQIPGTVCTLNFGLRCVAAATPREVEAQPTVPAPEPDEPYRLGTRPRIVEGLVCIECAIDRSLEGNEWSPSVRADLVIGTDGAVKSSKIKGAPKALLQAVQEQVDDWLFEPLQRDGKPTEVPVTIRFTVAPPRKMK